MILPESEKEGVIIRSFCKNYLFEFLHMSIALFLGISIYAVFRQDTFIGELFGRFLPWLPDVTMPGAAGLHSGINEAEGRRSALPVMFFRNFAGDMLWAYALMFAVRMFLKDSLGIWQTAGLCFLFSVMVEGMQKFGILSGTFDIWDIILEGAAILTALFLIKIHKDTNEKKCEHKISHY